MADLFYESFMKKKKKSSSSTGYYDNPDYSDDDTGGSDDAFFESFMANAKAKRQAADEEAEVQKSYADEAKKVADENVAAGKNPDGSKKEEEKKGNPLSAVGNFVKDAVVDVKDQAVNAYTGVKDTVQGSFAAKDMERQSEEKLRLVQETSKQLQRAMGADYDNPNSTRWDSPEIRQIIDNGNRLAKEFDEKNEPQRQKNQKEFEESQKVDAGKTAVGAAETFLNVATLGVGTGLKAGAKQGVKTAVKNGVKQGAKEGTEAAMKTAVGKGGRELVGHMAKDALVGGAYGITATLKKANEEGKDWSELGLDDYAGNVLLGTAIGAGAPVALKGAGKVLGKTDKAAGRVVQKIASPGAKEAAEDTAMRRALSEIGENGIVGTLNKSLSYAGHKAAYAADDALRSTKIGGKVGDLTDDFMSKWVTTMHPLYKSLKRSDFEGRTDGAYIAAREAIGNSNRALSYAQDYIENNPAMQKITGSLAARDIDLVKSRQAFDEFAAVKSELDLAAQGKKTFSKAKLDDLNARMEAFGDGGFDEEYGSLVEFYKNLNDFKLENGLMSQDEYTRFADEPFDYVRQQREIPKWLQDKPGAKGQGSAASITKSGLTQKRNQYASGEVLSPMETALKTAQLAHVEAYRNKAAKTVYSLLDEAGEAKLVRSTDVVREKQALIQEMAEGKPILNKMNRTYRSNAKKMRQLQTILNNLNKEGMNIRLKGDGTAPMPEFSPAGLGGDVPTSKAGTSTGAKFYVDTDGTVRGNDAGAIARNGKTATDNRAIENEQLGTDRKTPGLVVAGEGTDAARKANAAIGRNKDILKKRGSAEEQPVWASKLGPKDTRAFLNALVAEDPKALKAIRAKIENREPKLAELMDTVEVMNRDLHDMYAERKGLYQTARGLKTDVDKSKMTSISFLQDGVENVVKIDPDIAAGIHNWDKQSENVMNSVLRFSNNVFKYGTTGANPAFALPNFVADQVGSAINSKSVMSTHNPVNFTHSLFMAIGKPLNARDAEILRGYTAGNKGQTSINQYNKTAQADKIAQGVVNQAGSKAQRLYTTARHPKEFMRALYDGTQSAVALTENVTRIQNYRGSLNKAVKEGADDVDAGRIANQAARENSVDFLEMGSYGRMANSFLPYFNAAIQGNRVMLRNAAERPVSFAGKTAALVGMPVAATTIWNTQTPERKAIYDTIPEYVKDTNYVVITPGATWNEAAKKWDGVLLMKKPPGFKEFAEPVRKFIEQKAEQPDADLGTFLLDQGGSVASDFAETFVPISFDSPGKFLSSVTPQFLKPTAEAILNKNFFQGEEIVPDYLEEPNMDRPDLQKYEEYSQLTTHIGALFNTSPLKVDHWIKATFGEIGTNAQNTIDQVTGAPEEAQGGRTIEESVMRRFAGAPGGEDTDAFYNAYNPALSVRKRTSSQVTELVKAGRINEAKRKAEEYNASIGTRFSPFFEKFSDSPNYDPKWDERIDELEIKTSEAAFTARRKQK